MEAGKLRHRITIQNPPAARNEYGEEEQDSDDWTDFKTVWAAITPLSGRELWNAQQSQPDVTHRIEIRYLAGVTSKQRAKLGSRLFNFQSMANIEERNRELHIVAVERV